MPARRLYRYKVALQQAKSGTETDRVPVVGAVLVALWPGPRANGASSVGDGVGGGITVNDTAGARNSDLIFKDNLGATARQLDAAVGVSSQTSLVVAAGAGAVSYADGDQVVLSRTPNPAMFTDIDGQESVASVTTNSRGEAVFHCKAPLIDLDILSAGVHTTSFGVEGEAGGEEFWPEEFGAVRQGTGHASPTDDIGAFNALTGFLKNRGGGRIKLGVGTYRLNSVWTINAVAPLVVEGAGPSLTIVEVNHSGSGIDLTGANTDISFRNFTLRRVIGAAAGTTPLLQIGASTTRCVIDTVLFNAAGVAGGTAVIDRGTDTRIDRAWMTGSGGFNTGYHSIATSRPRVNNLIIRPEANWSYGFKVDTDSVGVRFRDCEVVPLSTQTGVAASVIQQEAGTNEPRDVLFDGCVFRGGTSNVAAEVRAGRGVTFDNCTMRDSQIGVMILGGFAVRISDCNIHTMQNEGIRINDTVGVVNGVIIAEPIISSVNIGAAGFADIQINGTAAFVYVNGMLVGNFLTGAGTMVERAVNILGAGVTHIQLLAVRGDNTHLTSGWLSNSMSNTSSADISHMRDFPGGAATVNYLHNLGTTVHATTVTAGTSADVANLNTVIFNPAASLGTWVDFTNAEDGQQITCINIHAANTVTFATGQATYKVNASYTMGQYDTITFQYRAADDIWYEIGRSANVP